MLSMVSREIAGASHKWYAINEQLTIVIELPWNFCITNQSNLKDVTPQLNVILTQNVITSTQTVIKY